MGSSKINCKKLIEAWVYRSSFIDKGKLGPKLKVAISPKVEKPHPPKLGCIHFYINLYLHEFFELNLFESIFDPHGLSIVRKGNSAKFDGNKQYLRNREATPTKIGVYAFDINPYLHKYHSI